MSFAGWLARVQVAVAQPACYAMLCALKSKACYAIQTGYIQLHTIWQHKFDMRYFMQHRHKDNAFVAHVNMSSLLPPAGGHPQQ